MSLASSPFDRAAVIANFGDDEDLLKQIAAVCVAEWPTNAACLKEAADAGDAQALRAAAHRVKGAFANFMAEPAVAAARRLELACVDGFPADHAELLAEALRRGNELVAALEQESQS